MSISPHNNHYTAEPPPSAFTLPDNHIDVLLTSYNDVFRGLRDNPAALAWILRAAFDPRHATDASHLDLSLSRGYCLLNTCARPSCASHLPETILQRTNTLLLPSQSRGQSVLGFFVDHTQTQSSPATTQLGRYTYSSVPGELFKCTRLVGTNPSSPTVAVSRIIIVNPTVFLLDTVIVSFRYASFNAIPDNMLLHSRHFSCHNLSAPLSSPSGTEGSFLGLSDFGVYDTLILPYRVPPGMQQVEPSPLLQAAPPHFERCPSPRSILTHVMHGDIDSLQASFVQLIAVDTRISAPMRALDTFAQTGLNELSQRVTIPLQQAQQPYISPSTQPVQLAQQLSLPAQLLHHGDDPTNSMTNTTHQYQDCRVPADIRVPSPHVSAQHVPQRLMQSTGMHDNHTIPTRNIPSSVVHVAPQVIPSSDADLSTTLALREAAHHAGHVPQRVLLGSAADISSTVRVNEVVAGMPRVSSRVLPANSANTSSSIGFPEVTENASTIVKKPPNEQAVPPFKKTLPAPTKSEIIIRNRISAQRSNEKRRRRIEHTKMELAYLKSYLPTLQRRKGCLLEENQSLKVRFMERYRESDVESFF